MRKIKNSLFIFLLVAFAAQAQAQDKGTIRASLDVLYGEGASEAGFNLGGEYLITSKVSAAPSYTFYFVEGEGDLTQINIDARYYLMNGPVQLYALGGYASLRASADAGPVRITVSDGGFNFGGGVIVPLPGRLDLNAQIKYSTPGDGQAVFQGGITYTFK